MKERNYDEFDYMRVQVKNDFFDRVISSYASFGWEVFEVNEDESFFDTRDVTLRRKHFLKDKDRLQLYQTYMDSAYSNLNRVQKHRYSTSTIVGLSVGLVALAIACVAIFLAATTSNLALRIITIVVACLAGLVMLVLLFLVRRIRKQEEVAFTKNVAKLKREIEDMCSKAKQILEENDDGKN